jgi:hypothetical protein
MGKEGLVMYSKLAYLHEETAGNHEKPKLLTPLPSGK